jgi:rod shape-determining protein MreC
MKKSLSTFSILFIIAFIILFLERNHQLDWVRSFFSFINNPVRKQLWLGKQGVVQLGQGNNEQQERIRQLENELAVLTAESYQLKQDNTACQKLLESPLPAEWDFVLAHTMGIKDGIVTLDRGEKDGVKTGDTVLVDNILLGRVFTVTARTSQAELVFSKNIGFSVKTLRSTALGKAEHDSHLNILFMNEVLNEKNLQEGEVVVTTGDDGIFPPGIVVGKIDRINKVESEIYQNAIIKSLKPADSVSVMFVRI